MGFPGSSAGKQSACNAGTKVRFLGGEDPLETDRLPTPVFLGFPGGSVSKESLCSAGDLGSIPGLGRSPGGEHGKPLENSCLENPHGQRSLVGCNPWGHKESDTTERLSTTQHMKYLLCSKYFQSPKRNLSWIKDSWNIGWYLKPVEGMILS